MVGFVRLLCVCEEAYSVRPTGLALSAMPSASFRCGLSDANMGTKAASETTGGFFRDLKASGIVAFFLEPPQDGQARAEYAWIRPNGNTRKNATAHGSCATRLMGPHMRVTGDWFFLIPASSERAFLEGPDGSAL